MFSNVRAGEEAQERASKTIATDLKARIAGFLTPFSAMSMSGVWGCV